MTRNTVFARLGRIGVLWFTTFFSVIALGQVPAPDAEPAIVYVETNPWLMVIGSDSPQFVLYDDGTVIFRVENGFRTAQISGDELAAMNAVIELDGIASYTDYAPTISDQPTSEIYDFRGLQVRAVAAYGAVSRHRRRGDADDQLLRMIHFLRDFRMIDTIPWKPEFIEVMIWPYDYAPEPSIIWPSEWPGLQSERTIRRGESYSLYVPSADLDALRDFLRSRNERGAVEIDGAKWAVSLRTPFPGEESWMFYVPEEQQ